MALVSKDETGSNPFSDWGVWILHNLPVRMICLRHKDLFQDTKGGVLYIKKGEKKSQRKQQEKP